MMGKSEIKRIDYRLFDWVSLTIASEPRVPNRSGIPLGYSHSPRPDNLVVLGTNEEKTLVIESQSGINSTDGCIFEDTLYTLRPVPQHPISLVWPVFIL
ncbi:hypothetical protein PENTCL1PPCAC_26242, partial [Pristionchus entomophagus]